MQDGTVDGLFDFEEPAPQPEVRPAPMTPLQRQMIRDLFAQLGVAEARDQFDMVADLTGVRIAAVTDLEVAPANVLIHQLKGRVSSIGRTNTGNAWADRDDDTWIDRL